MPIAGNVLAIRADGGAGIGAGHVMRCLALADAWHRRGGHVEWFCRALPPMLSDAIRARHITMHVIDEDWGAVEQWSSRHRGAWVCIDGYSLHEGPARMRRAGARVLVLADDGRWGRYECDALLNQVVGAEQIVYDAPPAAIQMLGSGFCLLRREFIARTPQPARSKVRNAFVSFGGHDAHCLSARIAPLLAATFPAWQINVAAGVIPGGAAAALPNITCHTGTDLSGLMHDADIAVVAAGSVCWELAYFGVPMVTIVVADNQEAIARGLAAANVARAVGWFDRASDAQIVGTVRELCDNADERREMSDRGRRLIDGRGADRVVERLMTAA